VFSCVKEKVLFKKYPLSFVTVPFFNSSPGGQISLMMASSLDKSTWHEFTSQESKPGRKEGDLMLIA
jgi:hypothetical protein